MGVGISVILDTVVEFLEDSVFAYLPAIAFS